MRMILDDHTSSGGGRLFRVNISKAGFKGLHLDPLACWRQFGQMYSLLMRDERRSIFITYSHKDNVFLNQSSRT
jgi:hypothetical protein